MDSSESFGVDLLLFGNWNPATEPAFEPIEVMDPMIVCVALLTMLFRELASDPIVVVLAAGWISCDLLALIFCLLIAASFWSAAQ
jgi:hypothetical protein